MKVLNCFLLYFLAFWVNFCPAQESKDLEPWLELIQQDPGIAELLTELAENPVAINTADRKEWQRLPLLTPADIDSILALRNRLGTFTSIRQLRKVIGAEKYQRLKPFLILNPPQTRVMQMTQRNYWLVESPTSTHSSKFLGNKLYNLTRFSMENKNHWKIGFIGQKDVGERLFHDYWNVALAYQASFGQVFVGSFYLQFGQGLLFSSLFGKVKSAVVMLPFKLNKFQVKPYLGSAENFSQNGLAFKSQLSTRTQYLIFLAQNLRDGNFNPHTQQITSFDFSGYHRTLTEEAKKDLIRETVLGFAIQQQFFSRITTQMGITRFQYSPSIAFNERNVKFNELRRNYYRFNGKQILLGSLAYQAQMGQWYFSGEWVTGRYTSPAFTHSLWFDQKSAKLGLLFWYLSRNFQSPYARVLDNTQPFPKGEQGLYFAGSWQQKYYRFSFYKLLNKGLWRTYRTPMPEFKDEWLASLDLFLSNTQIELRWKQKSKNWFRTNSGNFQFSQNVRLQLHTSLNKKVNLKTRVEVVKTRPPTEQGVLTFQQLTWRLNTKTRCTVRFSFYRTDSYNARIYEYENDVPGSFANFPLYGNGFKWFGLLVWYPFPQVGIWFKYRYQVLADPKPNDVDYGKNNQQLKRLIRLQVQIKW